MLLAIDTSTRYAGVALADPGRVRSARSWYSAVNHTAELMPAVSETLKAAGLTVNDLAAIAVALGPGGFSALRVGMSVAKGLALASGRPLLGIGTLDAEAQPYLQSGLPVCALLDAGRQEVSSALFDIAGQRLREDRICPPDELLPDLPETVLFCGEGGSIPRRPASGKAGPPGRHRRPFPRRPPVGPGPPGPANAWNPAKPTTWPPSNPTTCGCPPSAAPNAATG